MILSNLRASAWKYAAIGCAVLAVAAVLLLLFQRASLADSRADRDAATQRAEAAEGRVAELQAAARRDDASADATQAARSSAGKRQIEHTQREERVTRLAHAPSAPATQCIPASADLLRELSEGRARVSGAEDRLRRVGSAEGQGAD